MYFLLIALFVLPLVLGWYVQNQKNQTRSEAATSGVNNLVKNPGFQNNMLNWSVLQKAGSSSVAQVVSENIGLNGQSLKISNTQSGKTIIYQDVPVKARARYTVRTNGVVSMTNGYAILKVQEYDLVGRKKVFNDNLDTERVLLSNNTPHIVGTMVKTHNKKTASIGPNLAVIGQVQAQGVTPSPTPIDNPDCGDICYKPGDLQPNNCGIYTCAPPNDKEKRYCWTTPNTDAICTGGDKRGDNDEWIKPAFCGKRCYTESDGEGPDPTITVQNCYDGANNLQFVCAPQQDPSSKDRFCWTNPDKLPETACSQSDLNQGENPSEASNKFLRISLVVEGVGTAYFDKVMVEPGNTHHRVTISFFDPVLPDMLGVGKTYKFKFNITDADAEDIMLLGLGRPPCRFNEPTCDYGEDIPVPERVSIYKDSANPRIGWLEFTPQSVGDNQRIRLWVYDGFMPAVRTLAFNVIEIPPKKIFVTSGRYTGNLGGLAGADSICQTTASQAGLSGTYKAWLGTDTQNPLNYQPHNLGKYILVDGTVVAEDWQDLTDNSLQAAINKDELGKVITSGIASTWSGTPDIGDTRPRPNCQNWTSSEQYNAQGRSGLIIAKHNSWFAGSVYPCSSRQPLYCFEQ